MTTPVPGPRPSHYKGNSKLEKEIAEEDMATTPKLKKIEGIQVTEKKASIGKRINNAFGGQNMKTVGLVLLTNVIVPNVKDLLMDLISEGGRQAIYGEGNRRSASTSSSLVGSTRIRSTSYNTMSQPTTLSGIRSSGDTALVQNDRAMFDFTRYPISTREAAMEVIERMGDPIDEFGRVTVADLYDLIGVSGNGFTDMKHGWDANAYSRFDIRKVRDGWILILPTPMGLT